ncbi:mechanosensitive ion channel domain-containing protein [Clostridium sp.]|uniref:mechanosensitive ion channel family protein n=1 Tax=Clostridium sp. TaxID=1506 RepID=UPI001A375431|nr:mechanosensitive ion channel domain-containing protein [Clostridium sp.]MBK5242594.1 mechanosensitive ion channel [Clostridium sp.]
MNNIINLSFPVIKSIAFAIVTLIIGLMVIKWIVSHLSNYMKKSSIDNSLKPFILSSVNITLKGFLVISIINILGIDTSSIVAALAALGFALGLALQGSLSNFAGGILLLFLKPFKAGDYIEANGYQGTVKHMQILNTELITPDNKVIFIPNGGLSNASIVNYSVNDTRRVDFAFSVGYDADNVKVIQALKEVVDNHPKILREPEPFIRMSEHGDSAVVYTVKVWVNTIDYWTVYYDIIEMVKKGFDEKNISIPYPQMDVHINKTISKI